MWFQILGGWGGYRRSFRSSVSSWVRISHPATSGEIGAQFSWNGPLRTPAVLVTTDPHLPKDTLDLSFRLCIKFIGKGVREQQCQEVKLSDPGLVFDLDNPLSLHTPVAAESPVPANAHHLSLIPEFRPLGPWGPCWRPLHPSPSTCLRMDWWGRQRKRIRNQTDNNRTMKIKRGGRGGEMMRRESALGTNCRKLETALVFLFCF